jgi:hypothetical protein
VLLRILFVAWMASLGADRVDLLGGRGPALLLPFHVLTPLVLVALWGPRLLRGAGPSPSPALRGYAAWLLALLTLTGLSLLQSADLSISAGRFTLLATTVVGVAAVVWGLAEHEASSREGLVQSGARAGLAVSLLFNVATGLALLGVLPSTATLGPGTINLEPVLYGILPRLSGAALDMNRGAMLVLVFGTLVAMGPRRPSRGWWTAAAALMLLGSLSRSAMLAAVPVIALALWRRRAAEIEQSPDVLSRGLRNSRLAGAALLLGVCVAGATLLDTSLRENTARTLAPLAERFSPQEGSAQTHAYLLTRGVEAGTRSVPQSMFGIGFGTSFRELADVFGGNPYGNYHSAWLQFWVEAGFLVMLVAMAVALLPLRKRPRLAGLVLGLFVYNAFYIATGDPLYWLATGLAWLEPDA